MEINGYDGDVDETGVNHLHSYIVILKISSPLTFTYFLFVFLSSFLFFLLDLDSFGGLSVGLFSRVEKSQEICFLFNSMPSDTWSKAGVSGEGSYFYIRRSMRGIASP